MVDALSSEFVPWQVVTGKVRCKTQRSKPKDEIELRIHLNHFNDVEPIPFDILVDVPAGKCINCLGPRHFKCDKPQSHDYCFNCGRHGVRVSTCPRCRNAYPSYLERRKNAGLEHDAGKVMVNKIQNNPLEPFTFKNDLFPSITKEIKSDPILSTINKTEMLSSLSMDNALYLQDGNSIESIKTSKFTDNYLHDLKNLVTTVKHLPLLNQNSMVLQFISERQKLIVQKRMFD